MIIKLFVLSCKLSKRLFNNLLLSLQESINNFLQWTELNHMSLNSYKTKYMTITTRQKRQNIFSRMPHYIGKEKIVEVATHKVLGVTIDNNLSWKKSYKCTNQTCFSKAVPTLKK